VAPLPSATTAVALADRTRHDVTTILERPVLLAEGIWSSTDVVLNQTLSKTTFLADTPQYIKEFNFPQDLFANSKLARDKLANFLYLKSDMEIELKVNATPFQSGCLLLAYNPYVNYVSGFRAKGAEYLAGVTSLPHRTLNLEDGNSVKMTIPYANIYDYFNLNDDLDQFGTVRLYILAPLRTATSSETVSYTVFGRFIKPEYYTPTVSNQVSRTYAAHTLCDVAGNQEEFEKMFAHFKTRFDCSKLMAQVGTEGEQTGPVSRISGALATIGDTLAPIPLIGGVMSKLSWIARGVGRAAAAFGWSKGTEQIMPIGTLNLPGKYMANVEGKDYSQTLALISDNAIDSSKVIPEPQDEMSLGYIFDKPNFIKRFAATTSDFSARKLLGSWEVSPFHTGQIDPSDGSSLNLGSFAYASMLGSWWRGTLQYTITVVKTAYHSGRFVMVYYPDLFGDKIPQVLGDEITTCYNTICDLRLKNEEGAQVGYPLVVPYISHVPWKQTLLHLAGVPTPNTTRTATGTVAIYSLNDLVAPETVSDTVEFLVQIRGGHDYEIAIPSDLLAGGYSNLPTNDLITTALVDELNSVTMSGDTIVNIETDFYDIDVPTLKVVDQTQNLADWSVYFSNVDVNVPDGRYLTKPITVTMAPATYFDAKDITYTVTIQGGTVMEVRTPDKLVPIKASGGGIIFTPSAVSTTRIVAQSGRYDDLASEDLLVPQSMLASVKEATMGEYFVSLRALIKRFHRTPCVYPKSIRNIYSHI